MRLHPMSVLLRPAGIAAAVMLVLGAVAPAWATGSFACAIKDKKVTFEADAVFSHGLGGAFSNFNAQLALNGAAVPENLAKLDLDREALVHHWLHDGELRLHLYRERADGPHGEVELVLMTRESPKDETVYEGRYVLRVSEVREGASEPVAQVFKGRVRCSVG